MNSKIAHRLLDMLSVLIFTGIAYATLKIIATRFDTEGWVVFAIFMAAVADKLGIRHIHRLISRNDH